QAVGGHEDAAFFGREFRNFDAAFVVAQPPGDGSNADIIKLAAQSALQSFGDVIGGGDVATPDAGMEAFAQKRCNKFGAPSELGVAGCERNGTGETRDFAEFAPLAVRKSLLH